MMGYSKFCPSIALFNHRGFCYDILAMENHEVLVLVSSDPPDRIKGIARLAGEHGWHLRTESRRMPPKGWHGDGVLAMLDGSKEEMDFIRTVRRRGIPVVDLIEDCPDVDVPRITGDNPEIGRLAAAHFNERDFRHAAFFSIRHHHTHDLRIQGFNEVWRGEPLKTWIWPDAAGTDQGDWLKLGKWLAAKLREAPKPLAVFCWNDYDSTHVLNACRQLELKVPDDVAILGVDNNPIICEHQSVNLTSIAHDHERVGYMAAATLERLMSGGTIRNRLVRVKPTGIVTRESTETFAVYDKALVPAIDYIAANLSRPLGAAQIAAALNISRVKLDRLFAARLGHSAGTEIARRRLARAKKLLEHTDRSLAEIAAECGYCHASFFIRTFKKATGFTPKAWRRNHALYAIIE